MCVCAHNEAASLPDLLESLASCPPISVGAWPVYVMASGCTDGTVAIAQRFGRRHETMDVKVVAEDSRTGKLHSVNRFVDTVDARVAVFIDADVRIGVGSLERLVSTLQEDPGIGIAVAIRRSVDEASDFWGFCEEVQAALHNVLPPKAGRLYAIRMDLAHVDEQAAADDTFQEWACWTAGRRIVRVEEAVVTNRGPRTAGDYVRLRRRIIVQHTNLLRRTGYRPATMRRWELARAAWRLRRRRHIVRMTGAATLEVIALALATWDVHARGRDYLVWPVVESTKYLTEPQGLH